MDKKKHSNWQRLELAGSPEKPEMDVIDYPSGKTSKKGILKGGPLSDKEFKQLEVDITLPHKESSKAYGTKANTKIMELKKGGLVKKKPYFGGGMVKGYGKAVRGTRKCKVK